jgi:hypothetical protein
VAPHIPRADDDGSLQPVVPSAFRDTRCPTVRHVSLNGAARGPYPRDAEACRPLRACYTRGSFASFAFPMCRSGETGRRAGLKIPWGSPPVWVRFPPPAPFLNRLRPFDYPRSGVAQLHRAARVQVCPVSGQCLQRLRYVCRRRVMEGQEGGMAGSAARRRWCRARTAREGHEALDPPSSPRPCRIGADRYSASSAALPVRPDSDGADGDGLS